MLYQECYKILYSVQKNFLKSAKVLPKIRHIQRAQYSLNRHLDDAIPIILENDRETARFDYRAFTDYILTKFSLNAYKNK
jgi:phytoene/squalene synthetase